VLEFGAPFVAVPVPVALAFAVEVGGVFGLVGGGEMIDVVAVDPGAVPGEAAAWS
jgi:hypothetical protein